MKFTSTLLVLASAGAVVAVSCDSLFTKTALLIRLQVAPKRRHAAR